MPDSRPSSGRQLLRLANRLRARGIAEVAGTARGRLSEAWKSEETLILLVRKAAPLETDGDGLLFRRADPGDAARYARDVGTDSASTFRSRLAQDVFCFIVEDGERILHSSWVTTSAAWTREVQAMLAPPPGDAYVYESFTRADARGRGIYPLALAGIVTELALRGTRQVWVGVEASNSASRRAIAKAGFEEGFQIRFSRRLGRLKIAPPVGPRAVEGKLFLIRG